MNYGLYFLQAGYDKSLISRFDWNKKKYDSKLQISIFPGRFSDFPSFYNRTFPLSQWFMFTISSGLQLDEQRNHQVTEFNRLPFYLNTIRPFTIVLQA